MNAKWDYSQVLFPATVVAIDCRVPQGTTGLAEYVDGDTWRLHVHGRTLDGGKTCETCDVRADVPRTAIAVDVPPRRRLA